MARSHTRRRHMPYFTALSGDHFLPARITEHDVARGRQHTSPQLHRLSFGKTNARFVAACHALKDAQG